MRILSLSGASIRQIYSGQIQGVQTDATIGREQQRLSAKDRIDLSADTKELANAREMAKELPDARMDKVAGIKTELDSGRYQVSSQAVAEQMLQAASFFS